MVKKHVQASKSVVVPESSAVEGEPTVKAAVATKVVAPAQVTPASPIADRVKQATTYVQMAVAILALNAPALTASQRKSLGTMKKGGEKFIPQLAQIAQEWAVQIRTQPTAAMTSAIELATALQPLLPILAGMVREIQDVSAEANGTSWSTASALYAVLKRMSRKDPKLKAQLAPVAEFFAYRRPVATEASAVTTAKPGKTARRKAKEVEAAQALVAEVAPAPAPQPASAAGATGATTAAPVTHS
jgi:hypothetical protein